MTASQLVKSSGIVCGKNSTDGSGFSHKQSLVGLEPIPSARHESPQLIAYPVLLFFKDNLNPVQETSDTVTFKSSDQLPLS